MILALIVFIIAVIASVLLHSGESRPSIMEYCYLENIECKIRDHSICC